MERATHQTTRRANERLVLRTIYERGSISRADVARATGLTRTTVSDVVDGLIGDGLVVESGVGPSTGGKAPILLSVPDGARHLIGVDVDGEQLRGVVVDLRGQIVRRRTRSLNGRDGEDALRDLEALVALLVRGSERPLLGVGVGTAGLVDVHSGVVRWAVGLDWRDLPLQARLDARLGLPVRVMNDSKAAAVAEWTFDRHPDEGSMLPGAPICTQARTRAQRTPIRSSVVPARPRTAITASFCGQSEENVSPVIAPIIGLSSLLVNMPLSSIRAHTAWCHCASPPRCERDPDGD